MSTITIERPAVEPVVIDSTAPAEDEYDHIVCHCTGGNIAWCGKDVTGAPFLTIDEIEKPCLICDLANEMIGDERCPWGCKCTGSGDALFCGLAID